MGSEMCIRDRDRLVNDKLVESVSKKGQYLKNKLNECFHDHPNIGDIRGRGLFIGIEIVQDKQSKNAFDPSLNIAGMIKKHAFSEGLICYPAQGTIDGRAGDHILLAPAFIISDAEIEMLVEKLDTTIQQTLQVK